jgi:hypothetical protein
MWGALSDEKSGLLFSVFAGHRPRSLSNGTHEHSLLTIFLGFLHHGGPGSCIYFPQELGFILNDVGKPGSFLAFLYVSSSR